jgi:hypothetical protein
MKMHVIEKITNVHSIKLSWKLETTQMSFHWWMNKWNMIRLYNKILLSNKRKCHNMCKP